ncbi:MAG: adenine phosphoribosyltransferase [Treponemataceae bacterium]
MENLDLDKAIRRIKDFPKSGVLFYDITSLLMEPKAFSFCLDKMEAIYKNAKLDGIAGIDARGFIFAAPLADRLKSPLLIVRKKGKLPADTYSCEYELEYGTATIEVHKDDIKKGGRYLVVDDLVATGGTFKASKNIFEQAGATVVEFFSVIGLSEFEYEKILAPTPVRTLINY